MYDLFIYLSFLTTVDGEDGVAADAPGNLPLDTDFLLEQDLVFGDADHDRILGLEKFAGLWDFYLFIYFLRNSVCVFVFKFTNWCKKQ